MCSRPASIWSTITTDLPLGPAMEWMSDVAEDVFLRQGD